MIPNTLIIDQKIELEEFFLGFEMKNCYRVSGPDNSILYYVFETGSSGTRHAWNRWPLRPFEFQVYDAVSKNHLLSIQAPLRTFWYAINITIIDSDISAQMNRRLSMHGKSFVTTAKDTTIVKRQLEWRETTIRVTGFPEANGLGLNQNMERHCIASLRCFRSKSSACPYLYCTSPSFWDGGITGLA